MMAREKPLDDNRPTTEINHAKEAQDAAHNATSVTAYV
jgi:hypothetical protein